MDGGSGPPANGKPRDVDQACFIPTVKPILSNGRERCLSEMPDTYWVCLCCSTPPPQRAERSASGKDVWAGWFSVSGDSTQEITAGLPREPTKVQYILYCIYRTRMSTAMRGEQWHLSHMHISPTPSFSSFLIIHFHQTKDTSAQCVQLVRAD